MSVREFIENFDFIEVFEQAKHTSFVHKELITRLKSYYDVVDFPIFACDFFQICKYSLLEMDNDPILERTLEFITDFCLSFLTEGQSTLHIMLRKLFEFALRYCRCELTSARYRSAQIMQMILNKMPPESCIPDNLFKSLTSELLSRAEDIKWSVRSQAVKALSRLQNPSDPNCLVSKKIEWLCVHDPFPDVRKNALGSLILSRSNFDNVVICCRDISDKVRRTAYSILISKEFLKPLKLPQRVLILKQGFNDRNHRVNQLTQNLLSVWYNKSNRNPIELLYRIDGVEEENCGITCLRSLFDSLLHPTKSNGINELMQRWIAEEEEFSKSQMTMNSTNRTNLSLLNPNFFCIKLSEGKSEFERMIKSWAMTNLDEKKILQVSKHAPEHAMFWAIACEYLMKKIDQAEDPFIANFSKNVTLNSKRSNQSSSINQKSLGKQTKKSSSEQNESDGEKEDSESEEEDDHAKEHSVVTYEEILNLICPKSEDLQQYLSRIMNKYVTFDVEELQHNNDLYDEFQSYKSQLEFGTRLFACMDIVDQYTRSQLEKLVHDWTLADNVLRTDVLVKLYIRLYPNEAVRISQAVSKLDELLDEAIDKLEISSEKSAVPNLESTKLEITETKETRLVEDSLMEGIETQALDITCMSVLSVAAQKDASEKARKDALANKIENQRFEIASLSVKETEYSEEIEKFVSEKKFSQAASMQEKLEEIKSKKERLVADLENNILISSKLIQTTKDKNETSILSNAVTTALSDKAISNLIRSELTTDFDRTINNVENDEESMESKLSRLPIRVVQKVTQMLADILMTTEKIFVMPATLSQFVKFKIIPFLCYNDPCVRLNIIKILGICSQLHLGTAKDYLLILYKALSDDTLITNVAVTAIADIFILHGFEKFFFSDYEIIRNMNRLELQELVVSLIGNTSLVCPPASTDSYDVNFSVRIPSDYYMDSKAREASGDSLFVRNPTLDSEINTYFIQEDNIDYIVNSFLSVFLKFINHSDKKLKKNSILLLIKLLLNRRIISCDLFSVLVILWFDPNSDEIDDLRANISQFISIYAYACVENQMIIAKALFITIENLLKYPADSSLNQIDLSSVLDLFTKLTSSDLRKKDNVMSSIAASAASGDKTDTIMRLNDSNVSDSKENECMEEDKSHLYDENHLRHQIVHPVHDFIALEIAEKILKAPHSASTKWLIRLFIKLKISPKRVDLIKKLYLKSKSILKVVEKCNNLFLSKWISSLDKMLTACNVNVAELKVEPQRSPELLKTRKEAHDEGREESSSDDSNERTLVEANDNSILLNATSDSFAKGQNNLHLLDASHRASFYRKDDRVINRTVLKPGEAQDNNEVLNQTEESLNIFNDVTFNQTIISSRDSRPGKRRSIAASRQNAQDEEDFNLSDQSSESFLNESSTVKKQTCRKKTPEANPAVLRQPRKSILTKSSNETPRRGNRVRISEVRKSPVMKRSQLASSTTTSTIEESNEASSSPVKPAKSPKSPKKSPVKVVDSDESKESPAKRTRSVAKRETRQTRSRK